MKTLFINAKLWKQDGNFLEAFGIGGEYFNFTGTNSEANNIKHNYDEIIDLEGKLVLPGLIDGHVHLVYGAITKSQPDCSEVNSWQQLDENIRKFSANGSEWILGRNLNLDKLLHAGEPEIEYNDKPVFITNFDRHSGVCNKKALEKTGLLALINEFDEAEFPKNSGIVRERAMKFVSEKIPQPGIEEKVRLTELVINNMNSYGLTGISDITRHEDLEVYEKLIERGKLNLRVTPYLPLDSSFPPSRSVAKSPRCTSGGKEVRDMIGGFKAYYDGALSSSTALFKENYNGLGHNGFKTELASGGKLNELARKIDRNGDQLIVHAIGDLAVSEVLDLCEMLNRENGNRGRRFRIEHAQHIDENDFQRFKQMNVIASVQPVHLKFDAAAVKTKLPENTVKRTHNYKKLLDLGVKICFGTDFPIAEINPFENIRAAMTRETSEGVFFPENRIGLNDCIIAYTINNAYATFMENNIGSVGKEKLADFIIMENDLFETPPEYLGNSKVWKTYFGGSRL